MRQQLVQILYDVSTSAILDEGYIELAEQLIVTAIMNGLNNARASIWLLNDDFSQCHCRLLLDNDDDDPDHSLVLTRETFPAYFQALDTQRVIIANDAHTDPATYEFSDCYLTPLGINSMLDAPLRFKGKMIGIFCCEDTRPRQWQDDECAFLSALADLYGRALSAQESRLVKQQLEVANQQLEERVIERTKTLQKTLDALNNTQVKLIESEKMAALGNLVAGIAHEVNTPLGVAVTATSSATDHLALLTQQLNDNTLSKNDVDNFILHISECLTISSTNLDKAAVLISNFKQTAVDQSSLKVSTINLHDYLTKAIHSLTPLTRRHKVNTQIHCDKTLSVLTVPGALNQIIMNLVNNSCVHGFTGADDNQVTITVTDTPERDSYSLCYQDNGRGMEEHVASKVFEPFFTTSRGSGGSGLGMAIVYNLATQALRGNVTVHSRPQQGVMFTIELPYKLT
ncbi:GAF domain-containing sensor histidine kinase [Pseudoalteromonas shioyasakiensis]|uniref:GAF domain-containing sensor histidine kinase n=1 Tax=Pseudoalteromonas shioyasakiensis TaxID=1190813 RepID=UPI0021175F1D|nr:GAF domain-containing sensor histidine kinase [Pseudoalteromonas shioyasakiensis]MCQ8878856.1 GAF domain-containing sensor histidine kinase [Pseudoalteromonas shioyasakiensis]